MMVSEPQQIDQSFCKIRYYNFFFLLLLYHIKFFILTHCILSKLSFRLFIISIKMYGICYNKIAENAIHL